MLRIFRFTACLLPPLALLSACAHWWQVRSYSDFVAAEVQPGDQVRISTRDGERIKILVVEVKDDRIIGENQTFLLKDIEKLEKRSEKPPANPYFSICQ
jgi:hypothetical protein